jgi:TRAP-type C4-dicarboxylate transport system substrate-binding protein
MSKPPSANRIDLERRRFMAVSGRYGFTTAVLAAFGGTLWSDRALAQSAADEAAKQKAAKVTMLFATEYKIEDWAVYAVPQAQFKQNLEAASRGQIYVKLHPAGQLGVGAALAQKVQGGTVQGGAVSLSNFSPYAPAVDLINIPFWCGENQRFANLVTSRAWDKEITPRVIGRGFKPIFYFTVDPRTVATRRGHKAVRTPADMQGMKMRVPPSQLLQQFYRLAGANPTVVPWGETPTALKQGVADGLDPSISALAVFGFQDILANILALRSVPDAQMFAANAGWYNQLNPDLKSAFDLAAAKTQAESFAQIAKARANAIAILKKGGAQIAVPTAAEYKQWVEACGEQRKEWNDFKVKLAGSLETFERLKEAANTKGPITVGDFTG